MGYAVCCWTVIVGNAQYADGLRLWGMLCADELWLWAILYADELCLWEMLSILMDCGCLL